MATSRQRWLVGSTVVVMLLVVALVGSSMVTGLRRDKAVAKLEAMSPGVRQKLKLDGKSSEQTASVVNKNVPAGEDTVAAFERLFERRGPIHGDPAWDEVLDIVQNADPKEWTATDREKVSAYVSARRDLIRELARLVELGGPVHKLQFSDTSHAVESPHLDKIRDLARLLQADALVLAGEGDYTQAVRDVLVGMRLSRLLAGEPIISSLFTRIVIEAHMYSTVETCIHGEGLSPEQAQGLILAASDGAGRDAFADSLAGECLVSLGVFDGVRTGELARFIVENEGWIGLDMKPSFLWLYGSPIARPWLNMDEEEYANIISRVSEAARLPFYEVKPVADQLDSEVRGLPRTRVLSREVSNLVLDILTRGAQAQARHEAQLDLMRLGLAIEQYHAQNGQYPPTLDAVASALGGTIPRDPFTGQSFVYQPTDSGFTLYSAMGSALDADHRPKPGGGIDENGNIVWRGGRK